MQCEDVTHFFLHSRKISKKTRKKNHTRSDKEKSFRLESSQLYAIECCDIASGIVLVYVNGMCGFGWILSSLWNVILELRSPDAGYQLTWFTPRVRCSCRTIFHENDVVARMIRNWFAYWRKHMPIPYSSSYSNQNYFNLEPNLWHQLPQLSNIA